MFWWVVISALIILVTIWTVYAVIIKYPAIELIILLELCQHRQLSGRALQGKIAEQGYRLSIASFYGMMARLEDAGLVHGWYEMKVINEQIIKVRWYTITDKGERQKDETERNLMETYARGIRNLIPVRA